MLFYHSLQEACKASVIVYRIIWSFVCSVCYSQLWASAYSSQRQAGLDMSAAIKRQTVPDLTVFQPDARPPPLDMTVHQLYWLDLLLPEGGEDMLSGWFDHRTYVEFVVSQNREYELKNEGLHLWRTPGERDLLTMMLYFNLDPFYPVLKSLYPSFGRPSCKNDAILRSFALFVAAKNGKVTGKRSGIDNWVTNVVPYDPFFLTLVGCASAEEYPDLGSHYDLIDRLWLGDRTRYKRKSTFSSRMSCSGKIAIGDDNKIIDTEFSVANQIKRLRAGEQLTANHEMVLQQMLYLMAVIPSMNSGCIPEVCCGNMDSTASYEHASRHGKSSCGKASMGCGFRAECEAPAHFSCPDARMGYDSGERSKFYGQHLHVLSVNNGMYGIDLPVCFMLADAQRHDSVVFPALCQEMATNVPSFHMDFFAGDSAYDHPDIYDYLLSEGTIPLIALNTRSMSYSGLPKKFSITARGDVICPAKKEMVFVGNHQESQCWIYACPKKLGEPGSCGHGSDCPYRHDRSEFLLIDPKDSSRFFTVIPRDQEEFQNIMKQRSTSERVNKRILKDYNFEDIKMRNADHRSFLIAIICIQMHIDAWIKVGLVPAGIELSDYIALTGITPPHENIKYVDTTIREEIIVDLVSKIREHKRAIIARASDIAGVRSSWEDYCKTVEPWKCPSQEAARLKETGGEPTLEKAMRPDPPRQLELLPYEAHSVKCWEVPYMAYLPPELVIDFKGTAYKEEIIPEGRFKGFVEYHPPGKREHNGYKEVRETVWYRKAPSPFKFPSGKPPAGNTPDDGICAEKPELMPWKTYVPPQLYGVERGDKPYSRLVLDLECFAAKEEGNITGDLEGNYSLDQEICGIAGNTPSIAGGDSRQMGVRNPKWCNLPNPRKVKVRRFADWPRDGPKAEPA